MQAKAHNLQTTSNIKNRKKKTTEAGALWLAPRLMIPNRLPFWHFLPVQICAVIRSLGHLFIHPPGEPCSHSKEIRTQVLVTVCPPIDEARLNL
jgi:hypothetical protein